MKIRIIIVYLLMPLALSAEPIQRHILAFWDSVVEKIVEDSLVHRTIEMPLNHLGLDVVYHDINAPLPILSKTDGIRGVVVCFPISTAMKSPEQFIEWAIRAIDLGKKIVLMKNVGFLTNSLGHYTSSDLQNKLYEKLGFINSQQWVDYPDEYQVMVMGEGLFPFEKQLPTFLPGFCRTRIYDSATRSFLKIGIPGRPETEADLVIIGPHGSYISEYYDNTFDPLLFVQAPRLIGWYVNPFRFFELAFDVVGMPIPDTTTLAGLRVFISTCHGDNWNSATLMEEYAGMDIYNSEVILEKIIKPNSDIPIAVAMVAADLDPQWAARQKSQEIARAYASLPQVEMASHTYSHPFDWEFFHVGGTEKEMDYLSLYPYGSWGNTFLSWLNAKMYQIYSPKVFEKKLKWGYFLPRAYANERFDIQKEIFGSVDFLNNFTSENKKTKLLMWSGDSRPWGAAVQLCEDGGIKNFGGGFVQFDAQHPSTLFVYPLCRKPEGVIQLYASSNAENAYTDGWKDNFYRFKFLPETLINTESPRRLKPIHLYYHSFSGQFTSSVNAILHNIAYIRTQSPIAIQVCRYWDIGQGFFSVIIEEIGNKIWKILNRRGLQTIRYDRSSDHHVDFHHSKGVVGYKEHQKSLYVYLDASVNEPVIALSQFEGQQVPYLIDSSWEIWGLKRNVNHLDFNASGWGPLKMQWMVSLPGDYIVEVAYLEDQVLEKEILKKQVVETTKEGVLKVDLELPYNVQTQISIYLK